jgi:hypothetical protein
MAPRDSTQRNRQADGQTAPPSPTATSTKSPVDLDCTVAATRRGRLRAGADTMMQPLAWRSPAWVRLEAVQHCILSNRDLSLVSSTASLPPEHVDAQSQDIIHHASRTSFLPHAVAVHHHSNRQCFPRPYDFLDSWPRVTSRL